MLTLLLHPIEPALGKAAFADQQPTLQRPLNREQCGAATAPPIPTPEGLADLRQQRDRALSHLQSQGLGEGEIDQIIDQGGAGPLDAPGQLIQHLAAAGRARCTGLLLGHQGQQPFQRCLQGNEGCFTHMHSSHGLLVAAQAGCSACPAVVEMGEGYGEVILVALL